MRHEMGRALEGSARLDGREIYQPRGWIKGKRMPRVSALPARLDDENLARLIVAGASLGDRASRLEVDPGCLGRRDKIASRDDFATPGIEHVEKAILRGLQQHPV